MVLKNAKGLKWLDTEISSDDASQTTIAALAKKRIAQSQTYGYLGYQISSPMMYLTSGELVRLLTSEAYWPLFKEFFKASKQVVSLKLEEIGIIRNSLAHFRPLTTDDVEVVKQNSNQVLSVIEETLADIVGGGQRVPTNTTDEWYLSLRSLGGQHSQLLFFQSTDAQWIRVSLQFSCPIISNFPRSPETYAFYSVLGISPIGILQKFNGIREHVTCVVEEVPYVTMPDNFQPPLSKHLNFVFRDKGVLGAHDSLKSDFESVLATIDREADLIRDDNLARGEIVYLAHVRASKITTEKSFYWSFALEGLHSPLSADDPPEFWGVIDMFTRNFVSDAHRFPWMPVSVSKQRFPF